jgi:hypothetical protein
MLNVQCPPSQGKGTEELLFLKFIWLFSELTSLCVNILTPLITKFIVVCPLLFTTVLGLIYNVFVLRTPGNPVARHVRYDLLNKSV